MKPLLPWHCHKCNSYRESELRYAGPHIKRVCGNCGAYVEFIHKPSIPDVREIKIQIWAVVNKDLDVIKRAKAHCCIVEDLKGLDAKLQYWKL